MHLHISTKALSTRLFFFLVPDPFACEAMFVRFLSSPKHVSIKGGMYVFEPQDSSVQSGYGIHLKKP